MPATVEDFVVKIIDPPSVAYWRDQSLERKTASDIWVVRWQHCDPPILCWGLAYRAVQADSGLILINAGGPKLICIGYRKNPVKKIIWVSKIATVPPKTALPIAFMCRGNNTAWFLRVLGSLTRSGYITAQRRDELQSLIETPYKPVKIRGVHLTERLLVEAGLTKFDLLSFRQIVDSMHLSRDQADSIALSGLPPGQNTVLAPSSIVDPDFQVQWTPIYHGSELHSWRRQFSIRNLLIPNLGSARNRRCLEAPFDLPGPGFDYSSLNLLPDNHPRAGFATLATTELASHTLFGISEISGPVCSGETTPAEDSQDLWQNLLDAAEAASAKLDVGQPRTPLLSSIPFRGPRSQQKLRPSRKERLVRGRVAGSPSPSSSSESRGGGPSGSSGGSATSSSPRNVRQRSVPP